MMNELKPYVDVLKELNFFREVENSDFQQWYYKDYKNHTYFAVNLIETIKNEHNAFIDVFKPIIFKFQIKPDMFGDLCIKDIPTYDQSFSYNTYDNINDFKNGLNDLILLFKQYKLMSLKQKLEMDFI